MAQFHVTLWRCERACRVLTYHLTWKRSLQRRAFLDSYRPSTVKSILRTAKIFKFKDRFTSKNSCWLDTHCKTTQKCTSLHFVDRFYRSGSQGQGCQSLGQNSTEFNLFARIPRQYKNYLCLGLCEEGPAGSPSALCFIAISLNLMANFGF